MTSTFIWHWYCAANDLVDPDTSVRSEFAACDLKIEEDVLVAPFMDGVTCPQCNAWLADHLVNKSAGAIPSLPLSPGLRVGALIGAYLQQWETPKALESLLASRPTIETEDSHVAPKYILRLKVVASRLPVPSPTQHLTILPGDEERLSFALPDIERVRERVARNGLTASETVDQLVEVMSYNFTWSRHLPAVFVLFVEQRWADFIDAVLPQATDEFKVELVSIIAARFVVIDNEWVAAVKIEGEA
jgi:hypothetical protein